MAEAYSKTLEELQNEIGAMFDSLIEEIIDTTSLQEAKPSN